MIAFILLCQLQEQSTERASTIHIELNGVVVKIYLESPPSPHSSTLPLVLPSVHLLIKLFSHLLLPLSLPSSLCHLISFLSIAPRALVPHHQRDLTSPQQMAALPGRARAGTARPGPGPGQPASSGRSGEGVDRLGGKGGPC